MPSHSLRERGRARLPGGDAARCCRGSVRAPFTPTRTSIFAIQSYRAHTQQMSNSWTSALHAEVSGCESRQRAPCSRMANPFACSIAPSPHAKLPSGQRFVKPPNGSPFFALRALEQAVCFACPAAPSQHARRCPKAGRWSSKPKERVRADWRRRSLTLATHATPRSARSLAALGLSGRDSRSPPSRSALSDTRALSSFAHSFATSPHANAS